MSNLVWDIIQTCETCFLFKIGLNLYEYNCDFKKGYFFLPQCGQEWTLLQEIWILLLIVEKLAILTEMNTIILYILWDSTRSPKLKTKSWKLWELKNNELMLHVKYFNLKATWFVHIVLLHSMYALSSYIWLLNVKYT